MTSSNDTKNDLTSEEVWEALKADHRRQTPIRLDNDAIIKMIKDMDKTDPDEISLDIIGSSIRVNIKMQSFMQPKI